VIPGVIILECDYFGVSIGVLRSDAKVWSSLFRTTLAPNKCDFHSLQLLDLSLLLGITIHSQKLLSFLKSLPCTTKDMRRRR